MLKGGAMLYAIAVSFIIAVITYSFILLNYYDRIGHIDFANSEKAKNNVLSGLRLLMAGNNIFPENSGKTIDLFDDGTDSVRLERKSWGAFEINIASCKYGNQEAIRSTMTGYMADTNIAIYMPENNKPLSLCGNCHIKGTCYLSKSGVKTAYIEGKSFTGVKLIEGAIKKSEVTLPPLDSALIDKLMLQFNNLTGDTNTVIKWNSGTITDTLINSFHNKTIIRENTAQVTIAAARLEGNLIIRSKKSILVNSLAVLKDVILIAPKIVFEKNFKGSVQAFADSIIVAEACTLSYPSVLITLKSKAVNSNNAIIIKQRARIEGIILAYETVSDFMHPSQIKIDEKSKVYGVIYTNGVVQHKGEIFGSIYCQNFVLSTASAFYENHLLDVTIDVSKRSPYFVSTGLFKKNSNKAIVKWLD